MKAAPHEANFMSEMQAAIRHLEQELEATQQRCQLIERALDGLREIYGVDDDGKKPRGKRTSKARANLTGGLPDEKSTAIIAMLKKHGGVMKPGELARALKLDPATMRSQLKPLVDAKHVVVTGTTMSRRVALPGTSAKEEP